MKHGNNLKWWKMDGWMDNYNKKQCFEEDHVEFSLWPLPTGDVFISDVHVCDMSSSVCETAANDHDSAAILSDSKRGRGLILDSAKGLKLGLDSFIHSWLIKLH